MASSRKNEATIFGYHVKDPRRYGVVKCDKNGKAVSIEEKPERPKSDLAIPGLYFFPNDVAEIAKKVKPSARGELEITSVQEAYLKQGRLNVEELGRGTAWFDTGTHDALLETAQFVQTIERRQGLQICSPDEMAYENGWITGSQLAKLAKPLMKTEYGQYLKDLAEEKK